jgi:hypothetical protein
MAGALAALVWGLRRNSIFAFALAGVVAGLAMYFYAGARLVPVFLLVTMAFVVVTGPRRWRIPWGGLALLALGFLVTAAPMLMLAVQHPDDFNARLNVVGAFQGGWLAQRAEVTGKPMGLLVLAQLGKAALAFNHYWDYAYWYGLQGPFLDLVPAALAVLGLVYALACWRERRYAIPVLWVALTALLGAALTENPPASQRLVGAAPALAILVAVGLVRLTDLARDLWSRQSVPAQAPQRPPFRSRLLDFAQRPFARRTLDLAQRPFAHRALDLAQRPFVHRALDLARRSYHAISKRVSDFAQRPFVRRARDFARRLLLFLHRRSLNLALALVVCAMAAFSVKLYFVDYTPMCIYGNPNGQATTILAYYLRDHPADRIVYFFGAPRVYYDGFANLPYIAPNETGVDVREPLQGPPNFVDPNHGALFVFVPERLGEHTWVVQSYPGGVWQVLLDHRGQMILSLYGVSKSQVEQAMAAGVPGQPGPGNEESRVPSSAIPWIPEPTPTNR